MRGGWRVSGSATGAVRGPRASLRRPPEACEGRAGGRRNVPSFLSFSFSFSHQLPKVAKASPLHTRKGCHSKGVRKGGRPRRLSHELLPPPSIIHGRCPSFKDLKTWPHNPGRGRDLPRAAWPGGSSPADARGPGRSRSPRARLFLSPDGQSALPAVQREH